MFKSDTKIEELTPEKTTDGQGLSSSVTSAMRNYFSNLDGQMPQDLYELFISEVEAPLLEEVMKYVKNNQTKAAQILGLNRGTLRKKLKKHGL